jgi:hypothetical protein
MQAEPPQNYHVLVVDGFSGDAIPAHLLTREAVGAYLRHLRPDGALAVHISNRYLDLAPLAAALARERRLEPMFVERKPPADNGEFTSSWIVATSNRELLENLRRAGAQPAAGRPRLRPWTDDYSNILTLLK